MVNNETRDQHLRQTFQKNFEELMDDADGIITVWIKNSSAVEDLNKIQRLFPSIQLIDIFCIDLGDNQIDHNNRFIITYTFFCFEYKQYFKCKLYLSETSRLYSLKNIWVNSVWFEREIVEMFGIYIEGLDFERLLTDEQSNAPLLKTDFKSNLISSSTSYNKNKFNNKNTLLTLGPAQTFTDEWFLLHLIMNGEIIDNMKVELGFNHKNIEKLFEKKSYLQNIYLAERLNPTTSMIGAISWCNAIESALAVEIPARAQALRMVCIEVSRVISHLIWLGKFLNNQGIHKAQLYFGNLAKKLYELLGTLSGNVINRGICTIGGMTNNIPMGWLSASFDVMEYIKLKVEEIRPEILNSRILRDNTKVGIISGADAIEFGLSGPCLRASGVSSDLRKDKKLYFYTDVDFEIPLGIYGDCYDRLLVRVEEIFQSISIVAQLLDNLPQGLVCLDEFNFNGKDLSKGDLLNLCKHSKFYANGITLPTGDFYSSIEAPNGEFGFHVISKELNLPYRVKVNTPSYNLLQAFEKITEGCFFDEGITIFDSLDICINEVDK